MSIRLLADELKLEKFRSFVDVTIPIGRKITVISGVNSYVSKSGVRLFPYYLLAYIMPPLYKP